MDFKKPRNLQGTLLVPYTDIVGTNTPTSVRLEYPK
jgi:hypothetical protein